MQVVVLMSQTRPVLQVRFPPDVQHAWFIAPHATQTSLPLQTMLGAVQISFPAPPPATVQHASIKLPQAASTPGRTHAPFMHMRP